jgi:ERCC4-related helicase
MLIDNKTFKENFPKTIFEFFQKYIQAGNFKLVSGFFSASMLAKFLNNFGQIEKHRMILGNLTKDDTGFDKIINLLQDGTDILSAIRLRQNASDAVSFLKQEAVQVKTVKPNFCHAKVYLFESKNKDPRDCFYVVGSSNFTEAGLGMRESSNIELNTADFGANADYKEIEKWFDDLWKSKEAKNIIEVDGKKISFKEYLIELISKLFKDYSPETIYYKILYELFKQDLIELEPDSETSKQIEYLKDSLIFNSLYPFQQKGVLSLIKKIQRHNGAILADAVGLGKTWQALAVMKYFELKGYKIVLLCPKKIEMNWRRYLEGHKSKFEVDRFKYTIRYHTDLQDNRLESYDDRYTIKNYFQGNQKLLIVIDESHNLRNDKSIRYRNLVNTLLDKKINKDVKLLLLSATPINTKLVDVRNQFKLIIRGEDRGFEKTDFAIPSLQSLFAQAQEEFNKWLEKKIHKLSDFISVIPQQFFELSDALIVARTREVIQKYDFNGNFNFPKKEKPINIYISPKNIGTIKNFDELLDAIKLNFTAYRPADYMQQEEITSVLEDERKRQEFLAKMMYILLVKRLESSWYSFFNTVKNILSHYENALQKVNLYIQNKQDEQITLEFDKATEDDLDEIADQQSDEKESIDLSQLTLGKKNPIQISKIVQIDKFKKHLELDIKKLRDLKTQLENFEKEIQNEQSSSAKHQSKDDKLEKLIELIKVKQQSGKNNYNKKVVIFSVYKDTVKYLYEQLTSRGFKKVAYVTGEESKTDDGYSSKDFEPILERFAPLTKLFNEQDWNSLYRQHGILPIKNYNEWLEFIKEADPITYRKTQNQIEILIATDALSEGQNLQDCDYIINYDIHWNPVRIVQRMGRIDRLASPNQTITGVNFWPADSYEDYLKLQHRVEARMALMSIVGSEIDPDITPTSEMIHEGNPLISEQESKMIEQLQLTWEDIEENEEIFGFDKLSLETFRQELFELFQQKRKELEAIPNGVYTGFKRVENLVSKPAREGLIALIGYPKNESASETHKYEKLHLLFADYNGKVVFHNDLDILTFLRNHKNVNRFVPKEIDDSKPEALKQLTYILTEWLNYKSKDSSVKTVKDLFTRGVIEQSLPSQLKIEELYKPENFDLITWVVVS